MANKVQPGDKLASSPLGEAAFVNHLVDLVNHWQRGLLLNHPSQANTHGDDNNLIKIKNSTGVDLAMGEAVKLGDYLLGQKYPKRRWFEAVAIDTEFSARIAVAAEPIPEDKFGLAYIAGMCPVKYTGTAPEPGDLLGPKPDSAVLEKGYPSFARVEDITDSGEPKLLLATLQEIGTVVGKPQSDIAAATGSTASTGTVIIQFFDGTSYQATTFELTGTNVLPYKIKAGRLYKWVAVGGQWIAVELASRVWEGSIGGTVSAGASTTVTLSDGTAVSGKNVSGRALTAGSVFVGDDAYSGGIVFTGAAGSDATDFYYGFLSANLAGTDGIAALSGVVHLQSGATPPVTAADNLYALSGKAGDVVYIMRAERTVSGYLLIVVRHRRSGRYKGTLYAAVSNDDATAQVTNVVALDGSGSIGGNLTVRNDARLSGKSGNFVLIDEDRSGSEGVEYILTLVRHHKVEPFTALRYSTADHEFQFKRTPITAMWEEDQGDDWTGYHTAVDETYTQAVGVVGNSILYTPATGWFLEPATPLTPVGVLTFSQITVATNVYLDGIDEMKTQRTAYVVSPGAEGSSLVVEGTTCDPEE